MYGIVTGRFAAEKVTGSPSAFVSTSVWLSDTVTPVRRGGAASASELASIGATAARSRGGKEKEGSALPGAASGAPGTRARQAAAGIWATVGMRTGLLIGHQICAGRA